MSLEVHHWPGDGPVVLAVHGITANGLSWGVVADQLAGRATLLAPDLAGRAGSRAEPGPYGLSRHADDLIALLDERGLDRVVLAGHSMGAYVAAIAAVRHPDRFSRLVLVDGGLGFGLPPGTDAPAYLQQILGPAIARLDTTFGSPEQYRAFWRGHPAFGFEWTPALEAYLMHDLAGDRSSCVPEAIREDGIDMFTGTEALGAYENLRIPSVLLYADRGLLDQTPGAYTKENTDGRNVPAVRVPDTNHYSILVAPYGAAAVADRIVAVSPFPAPPPD